MINQPFAVVPALHSVLFYSFYSQIRCIALRVCKLRMGFSVPSIIWVGAELMQITMQRTRPAWPAKTKLRMTLDCSRKAKEMAMMSGLFVEGGRQTLLYSCKRQEWERSEKSSKKTSRLLPEQGDHKQQTLKHRNGNNVDRNAPITSKHVFPKRSAKTIDGTEKPKIPLKFAKRATRYNEFGYRSFSLSRNKNINWKPSSGRSQENEML